MDPLDLGPLLPPLSPVALVVRPLVVYAAVLLALRLVGKREVGELTPGDLVVLVLLSETLQGAMVADNDSLLGGLVAAGTLLAANWAVGALAARHQRIDELVSGHPTILIYRGQYVEPNMRRENVGRAELDRHLREQGVFNVEDVDLAILEPNGRISVRRAEEAQRPLDTTLPGPVARPPGDGEGEARG